MHAFNTFIGLGLALGQTWCLDRSVHLKELNSMLHLTVYLLFLHFQANPYEEGRRACETSPAC